MNPITQGCAEYDEDLKKMSDRFCANRGAVWVILCQAFTLHSVRYILYVRYILHVRSLIWPMMCI